MNEIDRALKALGNSARLGSDIPPVEVMPTAAKSLNEDILACGGLPRGRALEVYAGPSVGKSTLTQWFAGCVQAQTWKVNFRDGTSVIRLGTVCWFDAERSLMTDYAKGSGMIMDQLVVPDFGLGNDMLYKLKQAIALDVFDLIVIDSMQAVIPDSVADIQGSRNMRDKLAASTMWSQFFQEIQGGYKIRDAAGKLIQSRSPEYVYAVSDDDDGTTAAPKESQVTNFHRLGSKQCCVIFINHSRTKISTGFSRGPNTYTPGGSEKDYAFACRLELKPKGNKMGKLKGERILKYREVEIKATKNKLGVPMAAHTYFLGIDGSLMLDENELHDIQIDVEGAKEDEEEEAAIQALRDRGSDTEAELTPTPLGAKVDGIKERMAAMRKEKEDDSKS